MLKGLVFATHPTGLKFKPFSDAPFFSIIFSDARFFFPHHMACVHSLSLVGCVAKTHHSEVPRL